MGACCARAPFSTYPSDVVKGSKPQRYLLLLLVVLLCCLLSAEFGPDAAVISLLLSHGNKELFLQKRGLRPFHTTPQLNSKGSSVKAIKPAGRSAKEISHDLKRDKRPVEKADLQPYKVPIPYEPPAPFPKFPRRSYTVPTRNYNFDQEFIRILYADLKGEEGDHLLDPSQPPASPLNHRFYKQHFVPGRQPATASELCGYLRDCRTTELNSKLERFAYERLAQ